MLTRRALAKFVGAAALGGGMPLGLAARAIAQSAAAPRPRGAYLIKNGAVVTSTRRWAPCRAPMYSSATAGSRGSDLIWLPRTPR
jgi:hypothetical protein